METKEYQTVILGAFLHDIGKFLGRGTFQLLEKGQHPKFCADFVSAYKDLFSQIVDVALLYELGRKEPNPRQGIETCRTEIERRDRELGQRVNSFVV